MARLQQTARVTCCLRPLWCSLPPSIPGTTTSSQPMSSQSSSALPDSLTACRYSCPVWRGPTTLIGLQRVVCRLPGLSARDGEASSVGVTSDPSDLSARGRIGHAQIKAGSPRRRFFHLDLLSVQTIAMSRESSLALLNTVSCQMLPVVPLYASPDKGAFGPLTKPRPSPPAS